MKIGALERGGLREAFPEVGDQVHHALGAGVEGSRARRSTGVCRRGFAAGGWRRVLRPDAGVADELESTTEGELLPGVALREQFSRSVEDGDKTILVLWRVIVTIERAVPKML